VRGESRIAAQTAQVDDPANARGPGDMREVARSNSVVHLEI
jgi:hypothetical protein